MLYLKPAGAVAVILIASAALGQASMAVENNRPDKPILGLPFSADQSITTTQHLTNGITLTHRMTGRIVRSAAGIERSEATPVPMDGDSSSLLTLAWIVDRAQGTVSLIHVQSKFATVTHLPPNSRVAVGFLARPGDAQPDRFRSGKLETSDLGQRTQDGITAVGKLLTRTMPYEKMGNDAPFISTTEVWIDPHLEITVSQIERDPVNGDRIIEITNIQPGEPDPVLFHIPEGFKVVDQPPKSGGLASHSAAP